MPSHLLQVRANENTIRWDYFNKLYEYDQNNPAGKWCPEITPNHLHLNIILC